MSQRELHLPEDPRLGRLEHPPHATPPAAGGQGGWSGLPRKGRLRGAFCAFRALVSVCSSTPLGLG